MPADTTTIFDPDLVARYDRPGPRYTSYPTAVQFHGGFGAAQFEAAAAASNALPLRPLSLYVHVPFCESPCFYCGCNKVITRDHGRALPYLERLGREIALTGQLFDPRRRVSQLHFGGGTPTFLSDDEISRVLAQLRANYALDDEPGREYSIEIDPRTVTPARLAVLAGLGFNRISLGIQDFDPDVQAAVNRVQDPEETLALIRAARSLSIDSVSVDLIYGLPRQNRASFERTLERVIAAHPDRIAAYSYAHLPHIFKPQRKIRSADLLSPADKLGLLGLTVETLSAAGYVYVGMDHFALPTDELVRAQVQGTLQRNFQGYSTRAECDLVGLGVSSISKVGDTYAQNAKTLDGYFRALDAGVLPTERGVALSADDRLRRAVIQQLMCATRLEFAAIEAQYLISFEGYFAAELDRLAPLIADGLVNREGRALVMTARGRLLLRNVAMVFDAHLGVAADDTPRYSRAV